MSFTQAQFAETWRSPVQDAAVLIPAFNEAVTIPSTLLSIHGQQGLGDTQLETVVLCNGCTDNTAEVARSTIASLPARPNLSYRVVELANPARTVALNHGIGITTYPLVIRADGDVTFSAGCFARVIRSFDERPLLMSGAERGIIVQPGLRGSRLGQFYAVRKIISDIVGPRRWPMGRMMATPREVFDADFAGLYSTAFFGSEDTWLMLEVALQQGWHRIGIADGAVAYASPPATWEDLHRQQTRWNVNRLRMLDMHPHLAEVGAELDRMQAAVHETAALKRDEIMQRMAEQDIPPWLLDYELTIFQQICSEEARLAASAAADELGRYAPQLTTKTPALLTSTLSARSS